MKKYTRNEDQSNGEATSRGQNLLYRMKSWKDTNIWKLNSRILLKHRKRLEQKETKSSIYICYYDIVLDKVTLLNLDNATKGKRHTGGKGQNNSSLSIYYHNHFTWNLNVKFT